MIYFGLTLGDCGWYNFLTNHKSEQNTVDDQGKDDDKL